MKKILYFFALDVDRQVDATLIQSYLKYDRPDLFKYSKLKTHPKYKYILQISMLKDTESTYFDTCLNDIKTLFGFSMKSTGNQVLER